MTEPIRVPEDTPRLAVANIIGSPLTTVGGFLAGFAAYLLTNGDGGVPDDWQGWLGLIGGAIIAGGMAVLRGPKASVRTPLLIVGMIACTAIACKDSATTSAGPVDSPQALGIGELVVGGVRIACQFGVPAADRPAVTAGLSLFNQLLSTDPATAIGRVNNPEDPINANIGMRYIWSALHSWLDSLGSAGWDIYGARLLRQSITACLQVIT